MFLDCPRLFALFVLLFSKECYLQKSGVCIGSCVAPVLSDIYSSKVDRDIEGALGTTKVKEVVRYVDDFLVWLEGFDGTVASVSNVLAIFGECGGGLRFTVEFPKEGVLPFLELSTRFAGGHVCLYYSPRSKKAISDYRSAHSKVIKRGRAVSCLEAAPETSCFHTVRVSFQCSRLRDAGFPSTLLSEVAGTLVKKVSLSKKSFDRRRTVVVPYLPKISHNLKKVGGR